MVDGRCSCRLDPNRARTQAAFRAVASCKRHEAGSTQSAQFRQHQTAQPRKPTLNSAKDKVNPDVARDAARNKISKLEKALEVLSDSTGPAVDALKSELEKARQAAKVPPLNV